MSDLQFMGIDEFQLSVAIQDGTGEELVLVSVNDGQALFGMSPDTAEALSRALVRVPTMLQEARVKLLVLPADRKV